jgi:ribosomal protein L11 methylase PrmA
MTDTDSLSWNVFTQVLLQAQLEKNNIANPDLAAYKAKKAKPLPKSAYRMLLIQFRNWISKLEPKDKDKTVWEEYAQSNTYNIDETSTKRNIVQQFVRKYKPKHIVDIGCNIGYYSHSALEAGAEYVIGYDSDINAIELAFKRAQLQKIPFLPLYLDATNPSPSQGWLQSERQGFDQRNRVDMVIALAFEHHLAIGKNIPLDQVIGWITSIAPKGLIEFVPKSDKTIGQLLALKEDMFDDYSEDRFTKVLSSHASIVGKTKVSASGRVIYEYIDRLSKCASY